jgi:hypothetical protein
MGRLSAGRIPTSRRYAVDEYCKDEIRLEDALGDLLRVERAT